MNTGEATSKFVSFLLFFFLPPCAGNITVAAFHLQMHGRLRGTFFFFFCIFIIMTLDSFYRAAGYLCAVIYVHVLNLYGNAASSPSQFRLLVRNKHFEGGK